MNIQQFHYILAVAEYRHFETAAEKCFVAQSTLSTMISKFEEEIGIKVFDRRKKPVEITKEGEQILLQLKRIIYEIDHLQESIQELKGEVKGDIKIGCIPTIAPFLLPLFLQKFSFKYPDLYIEVKELTTNEIEQRILSRDLDIGIVSTSTLSNDLKIHPLYEEDFVLFDASNSESKLVELDSLNMDKFWLLEEGHCMRTQVLEICEAAKPQLNPTLNINYKAGSIDSLLRFVKANRGKTLLPVMALIEFTHKEREQLRYFKNNIPFRTNGLITHPHFAKSKILQAMQEEIIKSISDIKGIRVL